MHPRIYYNRSYALFFKEVGKYLKYGEQVEGAVDLVWSDEPSYEWAFRKQDLHYFLKGVRVGPDDRAALVTTRRGLNYYLAYSGQPVGVTLNLVEYVGDDLEPNLGTLCQWRVSGASVNRLSLYNTEIGKYLYYEERPEGEGIDLGWTDEIYVKLRVSWSETTLFLKAIVCQVTYSNVVKDSVTIHVNGERVWGPRDMENGDTCHLQHGDGAVSFSGFEGDWLRIMVKENDQNLIGSFWLAFVPGDYVYPGELDELTYAAYMLFLSVESARPRWPKKLEIAHPSLGHPLILKPEGLRSFNITLATRSIEGGWSETFWDLEKTSIILEDALTGERWNCLARMAPGIYTKIHERHQLYCDLRERLNSEQSRFPCTNDEFRAGCWMMSDFDVEVVPQDVDDLSDDLASEGAPRMFNLYLGEESAAYHSVFVSKTLPDAENISFVQVTDTHVAQRNDIIPKVIDGQLVHEFQRGHTRCLYQNPNDHLRAIIHYCNEKFQNNEIDFLVVTGDIVNYYHEYDWMDWEAGRHTNFYKFREIITGLDGLGEGLRCPLFVIPGNHEFYPIEVPLRFVISAYVTEVEKDNEIKAAGLKGDVEYEGDPFGYYSKLLADGGKPIRLLSASAGYRILVNTYPHFYDFLAGISYHPNFAVKVGEHDLVFLNTGEERGRLSKAQLAGADIFGSYNDYAEHGSHCRGFSDEHLEILRTALSDTQRTGLVFVFTHAPIINFEHNRNSQVIFEHYHGHSEAEEPPNDVTDFLYNLEPWFYPNIEVPTDSEKAHDLKEWGYPQWRTRHFKIGERDRFIDFGCAGGKGHGAGSGGGNVDRVLSLLEGRNTPRKVAVVFSGHTHHIHEYRVRQTGQVHCFYADNYSGTWADDSAQPSDKFPEMPAGHASDHLPAHQDRVVAWLNDRMPLLVISGSLKGKKKPQFREVRVKRTEAGSGIESIQMKQIERWETMQPTLGLEFLFAAESIALALLGGLPGEYDKPDRNSTDPSVHADWAAQAGRDPVMWELMNKYFLQLCRLRDLGNPPQATQDEMDRLLFELGSYFVAEQERPYPVWYKQQSRSYGLHAAALFYAGTSVRLNRLGVDFGYPARDSLDLQGHYEWALNATPKMIQSETENRIKRLFEFAREGDKQIVYMWYASESTYLAELGGYKIPERNDRTPSTHLNWALSLPTEVVVFDSIVKYELQAENQFRHLGINALKWFYSISAARLTSWGANRLDGQNGDSVYYNYYMQQCSDWDDQKVLVNLSSQVNQLGQKLITKER